MPITDAVPCDASNRSAECQAFHSSPIFPESEFTITLSADIKDHSSPILRHKIIIKSKSKQMFIKKRYNIQEKTSNFDTKMQKLIYQRPSHFSYLKVMRERNKLCDMTIEVETQLFPVHKCIMAGAMEYFNAMFLNDFKENRQDIVSIKNITATNMNTLIDFAYTGEIVLTKDTVESLIKDADYLMLSELKHECAKFLESTLHCTNAYKIYCIAEELSCISLKKQSYKFIREHIQDIIKTEEFLGLNHSCLMDIVIDNNSLSPTSQFEAIMRWTISDFKERKIHLSEILCCSNFFKLTLEYFMDYILKEDVIATMPELDQRNFIGEILLSYKKLKEKKRNKPEERIVVFDSGRSKGFMDIYNPLENKWKSIKAAGLNPGPSSFAVHENQLYTVSSRKDPFRLQRYNLQKKIWETLPPINIEAPLNPKIVSIDEYLYVCGGIHSQLVVIRYCPRTKEWRQMSLTESSANFEGVVAVSGKLYAIGHNEGVCDTAQRYDPQRNCWTAIPPALKKNRYFGTGVLNGKIFVCGGIDDNAVQVYDPITNRWDYAAPMNDPRMFPLLIAHAGKLWAFGGYNKSLKVLSSVEVYDIETDSWSYAAKMPTGKGISLGGGVLLI